MPFVSPGKVQLNTNVPEDIDEEVERVKQLTSLTKSEVIHLYVSFMRKFASDEQLKELAETMRIFGEQGLEKVI